MTRSRLTPAQWRFAGGMAILIGCACAPAASRPTPPTPLDFSGNWAGRTSQGGAMTFTVSPDQRITALSVDFRFSGCSGTVTTAPNVSLVNTTGQASAIVAYTPNGPAGPGRTVAQLSFTNTTSANGTVDFIEFSNCGSSVASWTAARR